MYSCLSDSDTETIQDIHSTNYLETKSTRNKIGFEPDEYKGLLRTIICVNFYRISYINSFFYNSSIHFF